jgi:molecular chaperone GrpE
MSKKKKTAETKEVEIEKGIDIQQETPEVESGEKTKVEEPINDFEKKHNELSDKYIRLSAEFDNFRRRSLKEKMDLIKTAGEDILLNILPVIDNFERALKAMELNEGENNQAIKEGILLIYNNFKDFLSQRGVKEVEATGKDFNADLHEAIAKIPAPNEDLKGKVIDVTEKGYYMHEKIIRFAKVVVGE